jgi:hypothetical protein
MMTIPPEMIDFIHIANAKCTACVQEAKLNTGCTRQVALRDRSRCQTATSARRECPAARTTTAGPTGKVSPGHLVAADKGTLRTFGARSQDR